MPRSLSLLSVSSSSNWSSFHLSTSARPRLVLGAKPDERASKCEEDKTSTATRTDDDEFAMSWHPNQIEHCHTHNTKKKHRIRQQRDKQLLVM